MQSQLLTFQGTEDPASLISLVKKEKKMKMEKKMKKEKKEIKERKEKKEKKEINEKKEKKEEEVDKEKILDVCTSPPIPLLSYVDHSSQMLYQNEDDVETTKSDGLEDLWNDMSVAIECLKVLFYI